MHQILHHEHNKKKLQSCLVKKIVKLLNISGNAFRSIIRKWEEYGTNINFLRQAGLKTKTTESSHQYSYDSSTAEMEETVRKRTYPALLHQSSP